jgi:two-component system response regulator HydG
LFGYEKGAFTGADSLTKGKFEIADGGTIFLDEIGDISPKLQADLLRVLQERSFYRIGGKQEVRVDVRVIAATNNDLQRETREGRFREDLYYRLNVIEINLPPLRERREDVRLLAEHMVERIAHEVGKEITDISEDALKVLIDYDWPGNVRELENALERAIVTSRGRVLTADDFEFLARNGHDAGQWSIPSNATLQDLERRAIEVTLDRTQQNVKEAAAILGIDRSTMYEKIKRYEITR